MSLPTEFPEDDGKKLLPFPHHLVASPRDHAPPGAGYLGLLLFIVSVGVLFLAAFVGFMIVRSSATGGAPVSSPGLPSAVWLSTGLILSSSLAIEAAHRAVRKGRLRGLRVGMGCALAFGALFLWSQATAWSQLFDVMTVLGGERGPGRILAVQFLFLTGLHAAHVVGGLLPMLFVWWRAVNGAYSSGWHPGVTYCALYWHFLGGVWIVTLAVLAYTT